MKIPHRELLSMYMWVGFDYDPTRTYDKLHATLRGYGPDMLKGKRMKEMWTPENPTMNYCYIVSEFVYWSFCNFGRAPARDWHRNSKWQVHTTKIPSLPGITHWFLKDSTTGKVVDLTADQFDDWSEIDYNNSRKTFFLQTGCKGPSQRAQILMNDMGTYN